MKYLLGMLHSINASSNRGSKVANHKVLLFSKFAKQVEQIFRKLPKRLEWISFYTHDLPLITELCEEIRKISIENQVNKSKVKALVELRNNSDEAFQSIVNKKNLYLNQTMKKSNEIQITLIM